MSDKIIEFASLEEAQSFASKIDEARRLPCCNCYAQEDPECECAEHRTPDGLDARPHGRSCALTYLEPFLHPTDAGRYAYPVDDVVEKLGDPKISDESVAVDTKAGIELECERAVIKGAEWYPIAEIAK